MKYRIRRPLIRLWLIGWLVWSANAGTAAEAPVDPPPAPRSSPRQHALLVGCTAYTHLERRWWLEGPANDVVLMQQFLTSEPILFDPAGIVTLVGWPDDVDSRPTRANIEREFRKLIESVRTGHEVVVLLAGHGSRQPADQAVDDPEPDGLDEIFLPADVKGWNGKLGRVENAIVDDEIRGWLTALRNKGASVWVLVDACHSGTLTRGLPRDRQRQRRVPAEMLVPKQVLAAAKSHSRTRGGVVSPSILGLAADAGDLVAMYAAQPHEPTPELPLPGPDDGYHGLFTYTVVRALSESAAPLTYRELADQVARRYRALGRLHPTPFIEGGGLDRDVLGVESWPDRPWIRLVEAVEGDSGLFRLDAGHLHGMTSNSILAVYPPAGTEAGTEPVGHLELVRVKPLSALARPVAYGKLPAPAADRLVPGSRCSMVFRSYGDLRMRVALQTQLDGNQKTGQRDAAIVTHQRGEGPVRLEVALSHIESGAGGLVERVADPSMADWYVRLDGGDVWLVPASGWINTVSESGLRAEAPSALVLGDSLAAKALVGRMKEALQRIARATRLLSLADEGENGKLGLRLELLRLDAEKSSVVGFDAGGRVLQTGDRVAFRAVNEGRATMDVTLLFVDSGYGIQALFPTRRGGEHNRLRPGEQFTTPAFTVTDTTRGPEQIVAIATLPGGSGRTDFSYLEQPTLQLKPTRGDAPRLDSPLAQLLENALYGAGQVRGIGGMHLHDYSVRILAWIVVPRATD